MKLKILTVTPNAHGWIYTLGVPEGTRIPGWFARLGMRLYLGKTFRRTLTNLGIDARQLRVRVHKLTKTTIIITVMNVDMSPCYVSKEDGEIFAKAFKTHFEKSNIVQLPA